MNTGGAGGHPGARPQAYALAASFWIFAGSVSRDTERLLFLAICETLGSERGQTCSGAGEVSDQRGSARGSRAGSG